MIGAGEGQPSAGCTGKHQHSARGDGGADQDIGPSLGAEDRHAVHQLAEHHLHGPGQAQPHADSRKLGRG